MARIALLTLEDRAGYVIDDELVITELRRRGHDVSEVPWSRADTEWGAFDIVIVRTTWDYHLRPSAFLAALATIERSGTRLQNARALIEWNLDKTYLRELEARGVPIVPTVWGTGGAATEFRELFARVRRDEIVVKPTISANATDTFRLRADAGADALSAITRAFDGRSWMAQPYVQSITLEGELSAFYFNGVFSHAIRKRPKAGDFRVQEEHGGSIVPELLDEGARSVADAVIGTIAPAPLQARVDLVSLDDGSMALMELELIEPSLYFRMDAASPSRFCDAIQEALQPRPPA